MRRTLVILLALLAASPAAAQESAPAEPPPEAWRFWARAEYLMWWVRDDRAAVPLAVTGPAAAPASAPLLGPNLDYRLNSGGKLFLGSWLDDAATFGIEASGFCLETHTIHEKADSDRTGGAPLIARPFYNTLAGQGGAAIVTAPADVVGGRYVGGLNLFGDSRTWGAEANARVNALAGSMGRWDVIAGLRYLGQKDEFRTDQASTVLAPGTVGFAGRRAPAPDIVSQRDFLITNNSFYGGQLGVSGRFETGPWVADVAAKVGLGETIEHLSPVGYTLLTNPAGVTLYQPGGLYVPPSSAALARNRVALISEVNLRVGYRITERLLASVGYTFLYWGDVIRPAGQVNPAIDPRTVPTSLSFNPAVAASPLSLRSTEFWAQGLTFGLEFRY